ncbi:hypothetical protein BDZ89DRAFT_1147746 [Hymenopellis radicata]|nr:hypothetical protein BDZ89DRAFT_1147746 [Hymenopellis radicata]
MSRQSTKKVKATSGKKPGNNKADEVTTSDAAGTSADASNAQTTSQETDSASGESVDQPGGSHLQNNQPTAQAVTAPAQDASNATDPPPRRSSRIAGEFQFILLNVP